MAERSVRIGIDSYSYHRFFGEVRPGEEPVDTQWTTQTFLDRAADLGVDGVSLETCYLDLGDPALPALLDRYEFERALAWGHPSGLDMGRSPSALSDALAAVAHAARLGCRVLRIVVGTTRHFGSEDEGAVLDRVTPQVEAILGRAAGLDVDVAIETHCDLSVGALAELVERLPDPRLGIVLDTANVVRIGDDLVEATERLAPRTKLVHLKDLDLGTATRGDPSGWWPSTPLGQGDLDLAAVLAALSREGFDGLVCVEVGDVAPGQSEDDIVGRSVDWLRSVTASVSA